MKITHNNVKYDFIVNFKENNKNLICFGSGSHNRDTKSNEWELEGPPYFERASWYNYFDESTIFFADPTFYEDDEITIGWYIGDQNQWYLEVISIIILKLCLNQKISNENILFFGSSGGGFAALGLATLIKNSKVMVNNAHFFVMNYWTWHINNLFKFLVPHFNLSQNQILNRYSYRFDIIDLFKKEKYVPNICYYVNIKSKNNFYNQFVKFLEEYSKLSFTNNLDVNFYCEDTDYLPMEKNKTILIIQLFAKLNLYDEKPLCKLKSLLNQNKELKIKNEAFAEINELLQNANDLYDFEKD